MKLTTWLTLLAVAFPVLLAGCGGGEPMPGVGPLDADTDGYSFQVRVPAEFDPDEDYQLVIAFHDNGESERQVLDWWDQGLLDEPDFILLVLRAPFLGERGYAWLPRDADPGSDTDRVAACRTAEEVLADGIEAVTAEYAIDEEDIILLGVGRGCDVALWMALTDPGLFDGLALFGGEGIPGWVPGVQPGNAGHLDVFIAADPEHQVVAAATGERFERAGAEVEIFSTQSGRPDNAESLQAFERFFGLTFSGGDDELDSLPEPEEDDTP
jgi:predicted esterase